MMKAEFSSLKEFEITTGFKPNITKPVKYIRIEFDARTREGKKLKQKIKGDFITVNWNFNIKEKPFVALGIAELKPKLSSNRNQSVDESEKAGERHFLNSSASSPVSKDSSTQRNKSDEVKE